MKNTRLHKLKSGLILLLTAAVLFTLLGGCDFGTDYISPVKGESGEPVDLTFLAATEYRSAISELTDSFNESHSRVQVTVEFTNSYYSLVFNDFPDDLPSMWFDYLEPGFLFEYAYILDDYAESNDWDERFDASALSFCEESGHLCGYPTYIAYEGVYYSTDIFSYYGLEEPATFEEFEEICDTLVGYGITPLTGDSLLLYEQLLETYAGAAEHDSLIACTKSWNCDSVVNALTAFQSWFQSGYYLPSDDLQALEDGTCAMVLDIPSGASTRNELSESAYGWFPFPSDTGRLPAYVEIVYLNMNLTNEELDGCMEYLDYVYSDEHGGEYVGKLPMPFANLDSQNSASPLLQEACALGAESQVYLGTYQSLQRRLERVLLDRQNALCQGIATPEAVAAALQENLER